MLIWKSVVLVLIFIIFSNVCICFAQKNIEKNEILYLISNLNSNNVKIKFQSQNRLVQKGNTVLPDLIVALNDKNRNIREGVIWVLGKIGSNKSVKPLIKILKYDEDWLIRGYAAEALGKIGDSSAVNSLLEVLKSCSMSNLFARISASQALGNIGDFRAIEPLIKTLEDPSIRITSAVALGKIGHPKAIPYLMEIFVSEKDSENLDKITIAIAQLREGEQRFIKDLASKDSKISFRAEQIFYEMGEYALEPLVENLSSKDSAIKIAVAKMLGKLGFPKGLQYIKELLKKEKDPSLRIKLTEIINNEELSIKNLITDLGKNDLIKKQKAHNILVKQGNKIIPILINNITKTTEDELIGIIEILGEIKDVRAIKPLIETLNTNNTIIRYLTIESLIKIKQIDPLINALNNKNPKIRAGLCEILGGLKSDKSLYILLDKLKNDYDENVKRSASIGITILASPDSIPPLITMLNNSDAKTVFYAIETLGNMKATISLDGLILKLQDTNPVIRAVSAEAIGKINSQKALFYLKEALNYEKNIYVREKLEKSIESIK